MGENDKEKASFVPLLTKKIKVPQIGINLMSYEALSIVQFQQSPANWHFPESSVAN